MLALRSQVLRRHIYIIAPRANYNTRYLSKTAVQWDLVKNEEAEPIVTIEGLVEKPKNTTEEVVITERINSEIVSTPIDEIPSTPEPLPSNSKIKKSSPKSKNPLTTKDPEELQWHNIKHSEFAYKRVMPPTYVRTPTLAHGLERVLFNPGVHVLQDPRSKVYNFTPFLQNITQPKDFDYDALAPYITSSRDSSLRDMALKLGRQYVGSTSSISAVLSQIYFMLSNFKPVDTSHLSNVFQNESKKYTRGVRTPASIFLRYSDGVYAIDADKSHDVQDGILSVLGKSMEKVLTLPPREYEKYLKDSTEKVSEEEKQKPESYAYGRIGNFLLRSQLDCFHPKLPKKVFDLKTRAVIPIRMDQANYTNYLGYSLTKQQGMLESFEREYYDMIRAAFLNFQARIGHMDGIFVAYHNTAKVFGFQYISLEEIDSRLFGNSATGYTAFRHTVSMMEKILDTATKKHPEQSLRLSFHARQSKDESSSWLNVFTEVVPQDVFESDSKLEANVLQPYDSLSKYVVQTKSYIDGVLTNGDILLHPKGHQKWDLEYSIEDDPSSARMIKQQFKFLRKTQALTFGPSNKAGASTFQKGFKHISDRYLRLEKIERRHQLYDDLRSSKTETVLNAWKELQSNKRFKNYQLNHLSSRVLDALDESEIDKLTQEYGLSGGKSELERFAAEQRANFLQSYIKGSIAKAPTPIIRKASFGLGLRAFLPREKLEQQLQHIVQAARRDIPEKVQETEYNKPNTPVAVADQPRASVADQPITSQEQDAALPPTPPRPSLLQRLKAFSRAKSSDE